MPKKGNWTYVFNTSEEYLTNKPGKKTININMHIYFIGSRISYIFSPQMQLRESSLIPQLWVTLDIYMHSLVEWLILNQLYRFSEVNQWGKRRGLGESDHDCSSKSLWKCLWQKLIVLASLHLSESLRVHLIEMATGFHGDWWAGQTRSRNWNCFVCKNIIL